MKLSIVTTCYFSAPYLREFYTRICAEAEKITADYELIFVNDGSPDNSLEIALELYNNHPKVRVIDFSRNFGHHKAIMTGLDYALGDLVFLIDSDLEEEPEWLGLFYAEMLKTEADVIYGVQIRRKGNWFEQLSGKLFYLVFNVLSSYPIPASPVAARLMSRRYVAGLVAHRDQEIFLGGLFVLAGFQQIPVSVNKHAHSPTTYNIRRKLGLLVNSITSFSSQPLMLIFYLGLILILLSTIAAMYLIVQRLFFGVFLAGWPSLIVSIWLLGGLTIFCLGVIGIYLSKIFNEVKPRPYVIIKQIYERSQNRPT